MPISTVSMPVVVMMMMCVLYVSSRLWVLLTWWRAICSSSCSPLRVSLALALLSFPSASWTSCSRPDWWFWRSVLAVAAWLRGKQEKGPLHFYTNEQAKRQEQYTLEELRVLVQFAYIITKTQTRRDRRALSQEVGERVDICPWVRREHLGKFCFPKAPQFLGRIRWGCQRAHLFHISRSPHKSAHFSSGKMPLK